MDYYDVTMRVSTMHGPGELAWWVSDALSNAGLAPEHITVVGVTPEDEPCPYTFAHTKTWCRISLVREG